MTNTISARRILNKYQNVIMNVKIEKRHEKWKNLEPIINTKGELYEDWAQIFEKMPGRFMIGTDFHFGREGVQISKADCNQFIFNMLLTNSPIMVFCPLTVELANTDNILTVEANLVINEFTWTNSRSEFKRWLMVSFFLSGRCGLSISWGSRI